MPVREKREPVGRSGRALTVKQEKVLTAAEGCFLRYGFRKTTMEDVAAASSVSRPALYLMYASKEDVLRAVLARLFAKMLAEVRDGVGAKANLIDRLAFAFEVWYVRPFLTIRSSPDAADLLENSRRIVDEEWSRAEADFERIITQALNRSLPDRPRLGMPAAEVAHVLMAAVRGFKEVASSGPELRRNIRSLLTLAHSGLGIVSRPDGLRP
jgi:AcrR family transcriptional regulator